MEILRAEHLTKQYGRKPNIVMPIMLDGKKPEEGFLEEIVRMLGLKDKSEGEPGIKKEGKRQAGGIFYISFYSASLRNLYPGIDFWGGTHPLALLSEFREAEYCGTA